MSSARNRNDSFVVLRQLHHCLVETPVMNIHYGNHGKETSRKAVLSIHECH